MFGYYGHVFLPYRCIRCENVAFSTLSELRTHTIKYHTRQISPRYYDANLEANLFEPSMDDYMKTIDSMFGSYSSRVDEIMKKYDKQSKDIEDKISLDKQLKVIRRQREKLKAVAAKWEVASTVNNLMKNVDDKIKNRISIQVIPPSHEINNISETRQELRNNISTALAIEPNREDVTILKKQIEAGVQLAAKYKAMAIDMEKQLNEKKKSEKAMQDYIINVQEKETEAKKHLGNLMEELVTRVETSEEKLEFYESHYSIDGHLFDSNQSYYSPDLRTTSGSTTSSPRSTRNRRDQLNKQNLRVSSAPSSPVNQRNYQLQLQKRSSSSLRTTTSEDYLHPHTRNDNYVNTMLEAPSSQELPRKNNRKRSKQLPHMDMSNVVDSSTIWPFSNKYEQKDKIQTKNGKSTTNNRVIRRRVAVFCAFAYLDVQDLLKCACVCREWRDVSRHPKLWTRVSLDCVKISSKLLRFISSWCTETCYLRLKKVVGRQNRHGESSQNFVESTKGSLEGGLEELLKACGKHLLVLNIIQCDHFITSRALWVASCHNRALKSVTYRSTFDPLCQEVVWSLGAGCRNLVSLEVAPFHSSTIHDHFNNRVVQMITWCWPNLKGLSIGGKNLDENALISVANNCKKLQVLELSYMNEISEETAKDVTRNGLKCIQTLMLTHTPVGTPALICFLNLYKYHLVYLRMKIAMDDFVNSDSSSDVTLNESYQKKIQTLKRLQKRPKYADVFEISYK